MGNPKSLPNSDIAMLKRGSPARKASPLTCQRPIQQRLATMEALPRTPKRRQPGAEDRGIKRQRKCDEPFQFPLVNFLAPPSTPKRQRTVSLPATPRPHIPLTPRSDEMKHYRTRSVAAREQDLIQRAALPHPDAEMIKGELTNTENSPGPSSTPLRPSRPRAPPVTPLSHAASRLSISSTITRFSSTDEEDMNDSRPQTPTDDDFNDSHAVIHTTSSPYPRRLQRSTGPVGKHTVCPWSSDARIPDDDSVPMPIGSKRAEHDLRIGAEQLRRLEALKRAREQQWAEAAAAGLFDDLESSEDETEGCRSERGFDLREAASPIQRVRARESAVPDGSRSSLGRTDTMECTKDDPPSKLRPTLPEPLLPYFRSDTNPQLGSASSTSTVSTFWTTAATSPCPSGSSSSMCSTSSSSSQRYVRRYQEDGVWKTAGNFKDLPALAHLESFGSMQSLDAALPPNSPRKPSNMKLNARVDATKTSKRTASTPQTRQRASSTTAPREPPTPTPSRRLRAAPRHSF
ncbi:hypothetical protein BC629DRAFT_35681 [Irpex lacteus]|nr:hypothetical protein BC629DRAFT_35681 [Irpex lacteus]